VANVWILLACLLGDFAVAADPTYFDAYDLLCLGYLQGGHFEKALQITENTQTLFTTSQEVYDSQQSVPLYIGLLRKIVNEDCKVTRKNFAKERAVAAVRWWQKCRRSDLRNTAHFASGRAI
jgi:hypothetical protein